MKIQPSDIGRFLQFARKYLKSAFEDDFQTVVFTFTESSCSIAMARDGLLLTYLFNRVDAETNEQAVALPLVLLQDCSNGEGVVDLQSIVENGESCIAAKWSDGLVRCERTYPAQDPPKYHLLPDLARHTVDERMVRSSATEIDLEKLASNSHLVSFVMAPIATATQ